MSKETYLTVKELAQKLGCTRQYIYKELNNKFKPYLKIINGEKRLHINVLKCCTIKQQSTSRTQYNVKQLDNSCIKVEQQVKQQVAENKEVQPNTLGTNMDFVVNETIEILKQQLHEKDKQLAEKDRQLLNMQNELNTQNEHLRKQSDRLVGLVEQVNELQRNNQVLLAQKDIAQKELETKKQKKSIFGWLSKKQSSNEDN